MFARLLLLLLVSCWSSYAQTQSASKPANLSPVIITGNPLGSDLVDIVPPAAILSGEQLRFRLRDTLGETLANEVGLSSSYYGPHSSRPVIRGLDGERIRILQNSVGALDASGASVDHAVSLEPLLIERIEMVRGPAALLYGTSAIGGVVNIIDNRIPTAAAGQPLSGGAHLRYDSDSRGRSGAVYINGDTENLVLHVDGFTRTTKDLRIVDFARSSRARKLVPPEPGESEPRGRLPNSANEANGGAIGGSYVWSQGYLGAAISSYNNDYGVVADRDITIDLRQRRVDAAGESRSLHPLIRLAKFKFGHSDYEHKELEKGEIGTIFKNKGYEGRVDITHHKLGLFEGALGLQVIDFDFSALGEEAFLPKTNTRIFAGFLYEEVALSSSKLQFGGRFDRQEVSAEQDRRFGLTATRKFNTSSGSLGLVHKLSSGYTLAGSLSYTERAPNYQELYASGPHLATSAFEVGNRNLSKEKSTGVDVALRKRTGVVTGSIGVYYNRFNSFIALLPTGDIEDELPVFEYKSVLAKLRGFEAELHWQFTPRWSMELRGDITRAESRDRPLPRIAPTRFGITLHYQQQALKTRLELQRINAQNRVASNELPTDGYTMLNVGISYQFRFDLLEFDAYLRGSNLLNREARNHVSFLKDIAPYNARAVTIGVQARF